MEFTWVSFIVNGTALSNVPLSSTIDPRAYQAKLLLLAVSQFNNSTTAIEYSASIYKNYLLKNDLQ